MLMGRHRRWRRRDYLRRLQLLLLVVVVLDVKVNRLVPMLVVGGDRGDRHEITRVVAMVAHACILVQVLQCGRGGQSTAHITGNILITA